MRPLYHDRTDAGRHLAVALHDRLSGPCVVAAIPRGGAIVGRPIADALGAPLTLALVRKVTLPEAPELAVGALDADGLGRFESRWFPNHPVALQVLAGARQRVAEEIERQRLTFRAPDLADLVPGRTLVLVDDGLATGLTLRVAIDHARRHGAGRILVAVPYASRTAADAIRGLGVRVVCPWIDEDFLAVGHAYEEFTQVSDEAVTAALHPAPVGPALRSAAEPRTPRHGSKQPATAAD